MNDNDLRDLFAAFAMLKMKWDGEHDIEEARECFAIADAMLKARQPASLDELGIAVIKSRKRVAK